MYGDASSAHAAQTSLLAAATPVQFRGHSRTHSTSASRNSIVNCSGGIVPRVIPGPHTYHTHILDRKSGDVCLLETAMWNRLFLRGLLHSSSRKPKRSDLAERSHMGYDFGSVLAPWAWFIRGDSTARRTLNKSTRVASSRGRGLVDDDGGTLLTTGCLDLDVNCLLDNTAT